MDYDEPKTYQEAMRFKMESLYVNQVWTLVNPLKRVNPIECKSVFKKKIDIDGNVEIFKGQLMAKCFKKIHGIDYDETFSLIAMLKSI